VTDAKIQGSTVYDFNRLIFVNDHSMNLLHVSHMLEAGWPLDRLFPA